MKKLYCFDFDGTLTKKDTMFAFLRFYAPKKFLFIFLKYSPLFVLVKLKLSDAEKVKKSFIGAFLKGKSKKELTEKAQQFFEQFQKDLIRPEARFFLTQLDLQKNKALLVTASLDIWTQPFADYFNLQLVSTKAEFSSNKFTGNFVGKNCNGQEKVERIIHEIRGESFDKIVAFGDTSGDKPMLKWANISYYRYFK